MRRRLSVKLNVGFFEELIMHQKNPISDKVQMLFQDTAGDAALRLNGSRFPEEKKHALQMSCLSIIQKKLLTRFHFISLIGTVMLLSWWHYIYGRKSLPIKKFQREYIH